MVQSNVNTELNSAMNLTYTNLLKKLLNLISSKIINALNGKEIQTDNIGIS